MSSDVLVAIVGGVASVIVSMIGVFVAYIKLKNDSSVANATAEAEERTQFRRELREEISRLREIIAVQDAKINDLEREIDDLRNQRDTIAGERDRLLRRSLN
jgi:uncharacterized protein YlxW (UPF0749 family)